MATSAEVLRFLIPNGGYTAMGEEYEGINFIECAPITKAEFEAGFDKADAAKIAQEAKEAKALETATAKLAALGLTAADLKALGL
jgi:hypothetical protein